MTPPEAATIIVFCYISITLRVPIIVGNSDAGNTVDNALLAPFIAPLSAKTTYISGFLVTRLPVILNTRGVAFDMPVCPD